MGIYTATIKKGKAFGYNNSLNENIQGAEPLNILEFINQLIIWPIYYVYVAFFVYLMSEIAILILTIDKLMDIDSNSFIIYLIRIAGAFAAIMTCIELFYKGLSLTITNILAVFFGMILFFFGLFIYGVSILIGIIKIDLFISEKLTLSYHFRLFNLYRVLFILYLLGYSVFQLYSFFFRIVHLEELNRFGLDTIISGGFLVYGMARFILDFLNEEYIYDSEYIRIIILYMIASVILLISLIMVVSLVMKIVSTITYLLATYYMIKHW